MYESTIIQNNNIMNPEEIKEFEKKVNKLKFIAGQKASALHDLIEDRLLSGWQDIPEFAQTTYEACKAWAEENEKLKALK